MHLNCNQGNLYKSIIPIQWVCGNVVQLANNNIVKKLYEFWPLSEHKFYLKYDGLASSTIAAIAAIYFNSNVNKFELYAL